MDVREGGLAIEHCRQFQAFIPYFTPFPQKVQGSNLKVAIILASFLHLMRTLGEGKGGHPQQCLIKLSLPEQTPCFIQEDTFQE